MSTEQSRRTVYAWMTPESKHFPGTFDLSLLNDKQNSKFQEFIHLLSNPFLTKPVISKRLARELNYLDTKKVTCVGKHIKTEIRRAQVIFIGF